MNEDTLKQLIHERLKDIRHVDVDDIPSIDLYMDQVTTFMENHLAGTKRHPEDKILTKTMINNYTKNKLLPPPVKKKYSQSHVIILMLIYYSKGILSLQDIYAVLAPLSDHCFDNEQGADIQDVYREIVRLSTGNTTRVLGDIDAAFDRAKETFPDQPEEDRAFLTRFALITDLLLDIYVRTRTLEAVLDSPEWTGYLDAIDNKKDKGKDKNSKKK